MGEFQLRCEQQNSYKFHFITKIVLFKKYNLNYFLVIIEMRNIIILINKLFYDHLIDKNIDNEQE